MDAGDNAIELIYACRNSVDVISDSEIEHSLLWLKWQSLNQFHPDRRLNLLGIHPGGRRVFEYHHVRPFLPKFAQDWWDLHEGWIREGIMGSGTDELMYQQWWNRFERWVGRWPVGSSIDEQQRFVSQLFSRPRWRLFQRLNSSPWMSTWMEQIQKQLLQGLYWEPIHCRTLNSYQHAPRSLRPDVKMTETFCRWTSHHTSMLKYLRSQPSNSAAGLYLGEGLTCSMELGEELRRVLSVGAPVLLWQHSKPSDVQGFNWKLLSPHYTGFLAGRPWVAFKESA